MEGLAIGRIVHYAQAADSGERPAIITKVWHGGGLVNLVVFRDGTLDRGLIPVVQVTSVSHGPAGIRELWHWPADCLLPAPPPGPLPVE